MDLILTIGIAIAGGIVLGTLIKHFIEYTIPWLKKRMKVLFAKKNVKKVAAMDLAQLVKDCPNQVDLKTLMDDGFTDVLATVNSQQEIEDVEVIQDKKGTRDSEIANLYGNEKMVVINS